MAKRLNHELHRTMPPPRAVDALWFLERPWYDDMSSRRASPVSSRPLGGAAVDALKIIGLSIVAAILYGVVHDQVTARVCVEYFTIGHPQVFATESPTLLGIGWGIIATWWVGALLGVPLAFAAIRGPRPRRSAGSLVRPIGVLLAFMGVAALVAGVIGFAAASARWVFLLDPLASRVPADRHAAFLADTWAHSASYLVGFVGGIILINRVWRSRKAPPYDPAQQADAAGRPQAGG